MLGWRYWKWRARSMTVCRRMTGSAITRKNSTPPKSTLPFTLGRPLPAFRPGAVSPVENVRLYDQGLRAHHPHQEVQGHEDSRKGFWHDLGYPRPPDGLFLVSVASELSLHQSNVVEFRHASWWNEEVYSAFHRACIIFWFCSGRAYPMSSSRPPMRFTSAYMAPSVGTGTNYSKAELAIWAGRIKASGA